MTPTYGLGIVEDDIGDGRVFKLEERAGGSICVQAQREPIGRRLAIDQLSVGG